jgi:hypothetical protein
MRRYCLILIEDPPLDQLRARWKTDGKQIGSLRFRFGFAQTPALTGECITPAIGRQCASRSNNFNAFAVHGVLLRRGRGSE